METELSLKETQKLWHGSLRSYLIGFFSSLVITSLAFILIGWSLLSEWPLYIAVSLLGLIQAVVQLYYFLHLGEEERPHWQSYVFIAMLAILVIIVGGSLWVMNNLNYRTMSHNMESVSHD